MSFRESHICEDYIIRQLQERGWRFVPSQELEREAVEEPLLVPNLIRAVERINAINGRGGEVCSSVTCHTGCFTEMLNTHGWSLLQAS